MRVMVKVLTHVSKIKRYVIINVCALGNIHYSVLIYVDILIVIEPEAEMIFKYLIGSIHITAECSVYMKISVFNTVDIVFKLKAKLLCLRAVYLNVVISDNMLRGSLSDADRKSYSRCPFYVLLKLSCRILSVFPILVIFSGISIEYPEISNPPIVRLYI